MMMAVSAEPRSRWGMTTADSPYIKYKTCPQLTQVQRAKAWLIRHRNLGGDYGDGWPLINRGNSFADTTCMAIHFFPDDPKL